MFLTKKIIFFSLCLFLFLPAIARAEEGTCCACMNEGVFAGFACISGDRTCSTTCSNQNSAFTPFLEAGTQVFAKGENVTCCACSDSFHFCNAANQTCNTICGDHGFISGTNEWVKWPDYSGRTMVPGGETTEVEGGVPQATTEPESSTGIPPIEPQRPNIQLPIPGFLGFSEVKVSDGGYLDIPWIAEYFTAVFNWLLAIVGAVATVMIMVGGFQYLIAGGDRGRIAKAKERIMNALIGLFLALGSYLILYVINPDLTNFKNIRLGVITRLETEYGELLTTTVSTGTAGDSTGTSDQNTTNTPFTSTFSECPITLTNRDSGPAQISQRSIEFIQTITSVLTGTTAAEKIAQVGEAAVRCGIQFGSCGKTTAVISTTAIQGSEAGLRCYNNPRTSGACVSRGTVAGVDTPTLAWMRTVACCPGASECSGSNPPSCCNASSGCTNNSTEAKRIVRERLNSTLSSEGWPDAWANQLQAGDEVVVYNGNTSYGASHSITFLGWDGTSGRATIIQSSWGNPTTTSVTCLKSACSGGTGGPLISRITRPRY